MSDGVNVVGYDDESGLGQIARLVVEALALGGIPFTVVPVGRRRFRPSRPQFDTNLVCVNAQMLPGVVEKLGASFFRDRRTIGFWWWEVDLFPPVMSWASHLVDEIWVGSDHVRGAVESTVAVPVFIFPVPIARPATVPVDRAGLGIPRDRFAFLFSFSFWSVFARKNPLGLIEAFSAAFTPNEGPVLVLKTVKGGDFPDQLAELRAAAARRPDVFVVDRHLAAPEYGGLVIACDAYASLHRAEGFGLTIAEAMALGKPAVATRYSGNLAFMTEANSYLVPSTLVPIPVHTEPYIGGGHWAEPDLPAAAALLRSVVEDPSEAEKRVEAALLDLESSHGLDGAATFIKNRLAAPPVPRPSIDDPIERAASELMWGPDLETARPWARRIRQLARPLLRPYVDHQRRVGALILDALLQQNERDRSSPD
jgi:glycosyltransferase involved in cell wall biosynthesis